MRWMCLMGMVVGVGVGAARAAEPVGIAVMEFSSKGGVAQEQMDALGDLLTSQVQALCKCTVVGKSDIRSALALEEQKMLLGCSDDSCMAEVGGSLGVPWLCVGNVSRFGQDYLLNLRLIDVKQVKLAASASLKVRGGQGQLLDALSQATRELLVQAKPKIWPAGDGPDLDAVASLQVSGEAPFAYSGWGHAAFWSGLGLAAFGGIAIWQAEVAKDDYAFSGSSSSADQHRTWNGVSYTAFGLGGALLVTGVVLWALAPGQADAELGVVGAGPTADGRGFSVLVGGRF